MSLITINVYAKLDEEKLDQILSLLGEMKMTEQEMLDKLAAMSTEVGKIGQEVDTSLQMIKDLQDQIANLPAGSIPQSVADAVDALAVQLQVVDDKVPDVPPANP